MSDALVMRLNDVLSRTPAARGHLKRAIDMLALSVYEVASLLPPIDLEKPYSRRVICTTERFEVLLVRWTPSRTSLPHDHGASGGWVHVLRGSVAHTVYNLGSRGCIVPSQPTVMNAGSKYFAPQAMVHAMGSRAPDAVTLHFYFPPIARMRVYDLDRGRGCVVTDDCGAWWPRPEQLLEEFGLPESTPVTGGHG